VSELVITDLHVNVGHDEGVTEILKGVDLTVRSGETHAIMGPNGSGKSTLAYSIAGHPKYTITGGTVTLDGVDVLSMKVDERARAGLFLAMQYPVEVPGVSVSNFLRTAKTALDGQAPKLRTWVKDVNAMSLDLQAARITPAAWQAKIKELYDRVEPADLLAAIDFDKLTRGFEYADLGVKTRMVELPRLGGLPEDLVFVRKIFGMTRDRAIIPHGHKNMVSCHYVLKGELRLKQYDKVEETATHMVIATTIDEVARVGSHSSISDEKNNVHWLLATTETAFTFDVM